MDVIDRITLRSDLTDLSTDKNTVPYLVVDSADEELARKCLSSRKSTNGVGRCSVNSFFA